MKKILFISMTFAFANATMAQNTSTSDEGVEINGIIWATRNVDAPNTFVDKPEDYGNYYLWEEAKNVCPSDWRLPTQSELEDLISNGSIWTMQNDNKEMKTIIFFCRQLAIIAPLLVRLEM